MCGDILDQWFLGLGAVDFGQANLLDLLGLGCEDRVRHPSVLLSDEPSFAYGLVHREHSGNPVYIVSNADREGRVTSQR